MLLNLDLPFLKVGGNIGGAINHLPYNSVNKVSDKTLQHLLFIIGICCTTYIYYFMIITFHNMSVSIQEIDKTLKLMNDREK